MTIAIIERGNDGLSSALVFKQRGRHCDVFETVQAVLEIGVCMSLRRPLTSKIVLPKRLVPLDALIMKAEELVGG